MPRPKKSTVMATRLLTCGLLATGLWLVLRASTPFPPA